jgi:hypothetical protein
MFQVPPGYTRKLEETPFFRSEVSGMPAPTVQFAQPLLPTPVRAAPVPCLPEAVPHR